MNLLQMSFSGAVIIIAIARQWLKEHHLRRTISIRQSDTISAPLTYGIFSPVILMTKKTDWQDTKQLKYILLHDIISL